VSELVTSAVREMPGPAALPRENGELVFDAPWQGRVLALAIGVVQTLEVDWDAFRTRLVDAIAAHPDRDYYEAWTAALESLVVDYELVSTDDVVTRANR
jgi:hypothetical protein